MVYTESVCACRYLLPCHPHPLSHVIILLLSYHYICTHFIFSTLAIRELHYRLTCFGLRVNAGALLCLFLWYLFYLLCSP